MVRLWSGKSRSVVALFPNGQSETFASVVKYSNSILLQHGEDLADGFERDPRQWLAVVVVQSDHPSCGGMAHL